jgi:hypothetical protein
MTVSAQLAAQFGTADVGCPVGSGSRLPTSSAISDATHDRRSCARQLRSGTNNLVPARWVKLRRAQNMELSALKRGRYRCAQSNRETPALATGTAAYQQFSVGADA